MTSHGLTSTKDSLWVKRSWENPAKFELQIKVIQSRTSLCGPTKNFCFFFLKTIGRLTKGHASNAICDDTLLCTNFTKIQILIPFEERPDWSVSVLSWTGLTAPISLLVKHSLRTHLLFAVLWLQTWGCIIIHSENTMPGFPGDGLWHNTSITFSWLHSEFEE